MAKLQTSPGNAHPPSRLCPPHLPTNFPYRYRTSKTFASSSSWHASYAISVRQTSLLPAASFRFHLALPIVAYTVLLASSVLVHSYTHIALFMPGSAALVLLFVGIHNAWDAATYHIFVTNRGKPKNKDTK